MRRLHRLIYPCIRVHSSVLCGLGEDLQQVILEREGSKSDRTFTASKMRSHQIHPNLRSRLLHEN